MNTSGITPSAAVAFTEDAIRSGLSVRLFGSVAIWWHCENSRDRFVNRPTPIADMDLVGLLAEKRTVEAYLVTCGWSLDRGVATIPGARYSLAYRLAAQTIVARCDIYYDRLEFAHTIDVSNRLPLDCPTLAVADLLLSKLQVAALSASDRFDLWVLLSEHDICDGANARDAIDANRIVTCGASSWGLYTTMVDNLAVIAEDRDNFAANADEGRTVIGRVECLRSALATASKSIRWRCRAVIGRRLRWYDDIDPIGLRVGDTTEIGDLR